MNVVITAVGGSVPPSF